jgi:hypothetical protein
VGKTFPLAFWFGNIEEFIPNLNELYQYVSEQESQNVCNGFVPSWIGNKKHAFSLEPFQKQRQGQSSYLPFERKIAKKN